MKLNTKTFIGAFTGILAVFALSGIAFSGEIHQSAQDGDLQKVKELVAKGADKNAKDNMGATPLDHAAVNGHDEIVQWLLQNGGKTSSGEIFDRILAGDIAAVKAALDKGTAVNTKDNGGLTLLHWAAMAGHVEIAIVLLDRGADVNRKDSLGDMPLHVAVSHGRTATVELLLVRGADAKAKSGLGQTLLEMAEKKEIIELLRKHGARQK
jgi:ankyrin repeat protein